MARGAALVQQLLTSARQTEARFSSLDLNALVNELEKMMRATFPKTITFDLQLDPNLPLVTADRSQIDQVLLNLCVNSRDAMQERGHHDTGYSHYFPRRITRIFYWSGCRTNTPVCESATQAAA